MQQIPSFIVSKFSAPSASPREASPRLRVSPGFKPAHPFAFTLVEVVLALGIASLLAVSVFAMIAASMRSSDELAHEALRERREEALQQLLRQAFLGFPAKATMLLSKGSTGEMRISLLNAPGGLGFAEEGELDGGWALEGRPQADGTRTLSLMRLPPRTLPVNLENAITEGVWMPLVPGLSDLRWQFRDPATQEWKDEWPENSGRPDLVALILTFSDGSAPSEIYFWVPNVKAATTASQRPSIPGPPAPSVPSPESPATGAPAPAVPAGIPELPALPSLPAVP